MSLNKATVARIAHLARIRMDESALATMAGELNAIFSWIEQLNEVDTETVPPLVGVTGPEDATGAAHLRADVVGAETEPERILANAPERSGDFFTVPKVVE